MIARAQASGHREHARVGAPLIVVGLAVALAIVGVVPLQLPALLAQHVTSRPGVLSGALSAGYGSVPILSLVGAWLLVRHSSPRLFVWASIGILVCVAAGQVFQVSEAIVLCQVSWPLLFAAVTGPVTWRAPLV